LSELVADYGLIGDLATTYGRIEELRWRLRHRSENMTKDLDPMTAPLIAELRGEVDDLLERVAAQIDHPERPGPWTHPHQEGLTRRVGVTASIETEVIRGGQTSVDDKDSNRGDEVGG